MGRHKIGGITTGAGITFVGHTKKVTIRNKDGSFLVKDYKNPSVKSKYDIPLIRGFLKLYNVFKMAASTWIGKFSLFMLSIGIIGFILGLIFGEPVPSSQEVVTVFDIAFAAINIIILIGLLTYILKIRHLHGLEHRFIQTYNKGLPITLENVKAQKKETPRCGGTLLGMLLIIELVWVGLFNLPSLFVWLLLPSVGFEMFLLASGNKWYHKLLYGPGWLIQQITTGYNVSDEIIQQYIPGFTSFVKLEDPHYFNSTIKEQ